MNIRVLLLLLLLPCLSKGGGFTINAQGQKANGMAGAFSGVANDATAIYYNPAAIAFQEHAMMNAGYSVMFQRVSFLSPTDGNIDAKSSLIVPFQVYATHHFENRKLTGGIGIYTPFIAAVKWNNNWPGRYLTQQTKLNTIFIQPTITYRFDDHYAAGIGLIGATGFIKMRRALAVNDDIELKLKGTGFGYGFNVGGFAHFERLNFSINYRSSVKLITSNGDAKFSNLPPSFIDQQSYPETAHYKSKFKLPSTATFGIGYTPTERITTDIDFSYTTWNQFDDWNIKINNFEQLDAIQNRHFKNSFSVKLGGQYHWSEKMDYRIGTCYESATAKENNLYPDLPDGASIAFAAGATRYMNETLNIEASFNIENHAQHKETGNQQNFNGSYQKTIYSFGLGVHYEF